MRFAFNTFLTCLSAFSLIQYTSAIPTNPPILRPTTGGEDHTRHIAKITWIKEAPPAQLTVTDSNSKAWFAEGAAELIREKFKVNMEVTFLKKSSATQTAHDVQLLWSPAEVDWIDKGKKLLTLKDHRNRDWFADEASARQLISAGIRIGAHVEFKRDPQGASTQTAFNVRRHNS